MKIRNGFVSNSSSSSFVCEITGEAFEIWDGVFKDGPLAKCENGHIFKTELLVPWTPRFPIRSEMIDQLDEKIDSKKESAELRTMSDDELREKWLEVFGPDKYLVSPKQCPICSMSQLPDGVMLDYMLAQCEGNREDLMAKIRAEFKNFAALKKFINR